LNLCTILDEAEIKNVPNQIGSNKAPVPDGITVLFYKFYCDIVKYDVIAMVRSFFLGRYILKELNHTNIALIPKVRAIL
jgi:hypothetical protein